MKLQLIGPVLIALVGLFFIPRAGGSETANTREWCRLKHNVRVDTINPSPQTNFAVRQYQSSGYILEDSVVPCSPNRFTSRSTSMPTYPWIRAVNAAGNIAHPMVSVVDQDSSWTSLNGRGTDYAGEPIEAFVSRYRVHTIPTFTISDPCKKHHAYDSCKTMSADGRSQFLNVRYLKNGNSEVTLHGQPMRMFVTDAVWNAGTSKSAVNGEGGELYYKVDLVPNNKKAIEKYVHGDKAGAVWAYVDSAGLSARAFDAKKLRIFSEQDKQTEAQISCCTAGRSLLGQFFSNMEHDLKLKDTQPIQVLVAQNRCEESLNPYHLEKTALRIWQGRVDQYMRTAYHPVSMRTHTTAQDLANIDMLARTLYGEMRGCESPKYFKDRYTNQYIQTADSDKRYYYAIAAVIMNRLPGCSERSKQFCNPGHADLAGVLTKKNQFSVWNPSDSQFKKIVCVDTKDEKHRIAWDDAVAVASEAILKPDEFKKELQLLPKVRNATAYYSPMSEPNQMKPRYLRGKRHLPFPRHWVGSCLKLYATTSR